jgi:hypothetical protein
MDAFPFTPVSNPHYNDWQYLSAEALYLILVIGDGWEDELMGNGRN